MYPHLLIDILTIVAIVSGPIIALELQRRLDREREAKNRKLDIFKTLMAYRNTALSPNFVRALNLIDIEFEADIPAEKAVLTAWKILLDHFVDLAKYNASNTIAPKSELEKSTSLTTNLLMAMGKALKYDFDEVQIRKGAYYPIFLGNVEQEQHALRRLLLEVLQGKRRIPVGVFEDTFPPITAPELDREVEQLLEAPPPLNKLSG